MLYLVVISICLATIPVASGFSGEVDYSIDDSIFEIEFTEPETWVNDDASEYACFIDEECITGFRLAGEDMEIKFQDLQSSTIPSISYMSTILVILLSLAIFGKRID